MNGRTQNSGKTWGIIAVAILAVLALVLSAMALLNSRGEAGPDSDYTYTPDTVAEPDADQDNDASEDDETSEEPADPEPAPEVSLDAHSRFIALGATEQVIRGEFGSCTGAPGWAEVSEDGGLTWEVSSTEIQEAMQLMGARIGTAGYAELLTLDTLCEPFLLRSYIGGYAWQYAPGEIDSRWFANPLEPDVINTPFGAAEAPCEVIQLSVSESATQVGVLCEDSTVMTTEDDGASWSTVAESTGAVAIAVQDDRVFALNGAAESCEGLQPQTLNGGSATDLGSCLDIPSGSHEIAVSAYGNDVGVWAGDVFLWSADGGSTWV